jgi:hypothetical protein
VNEADRELLMLLGSIGIRVGEMVTGLFGPGSCGPWFK